MRAYQAGLAEFERKQTQVLGISVNSAAANKKFAEKLGLTFPLLCDTRKQVSKLYGVLGFFRVAKRATFVVDKQGIIRHVDRDSAAADPRGARIACALL